MTFEEYVKQRESGKSREEALGAARRTPGVQSAAESGAAGTGSMLSFEDYVKARESGKSSKELLGYRRIGSRRNEERQGGANAEAAPSAYRFARVPEGMEGSEFQRYIRAVHTAEGPLDIAQSVVDRMSEEQLREINAAIGKRNEREKEAMRPYLEGNAESATADWKKAQEDLDGLDEQIARLEKLLSYGYGLPRAVARVRAKASGEDSLEDQLSTLKEQREQAQKRYDEAESVYGYHVLLPEYQEGEKEWKTVHAGGTSGEEWYQSSKAAADELYQQIKTLQDEKAAAAGWATDEAGAAWYEAYAAEIDEKIGALSEQYQQAAKTASRAERFRYDDLHEAADFEAKSREGLAAAEEARQEADKDRESYMSGAGVFAFSDASNPATEFGRAAAAERYDLSYELPTDEWTEEERKNFGYLYATDRERAREYAVDLNNSRAFKAQQEALKRETSGRIGGEWIGARAAGLVSGGDFLMRAVEYGAHGYTKQPEYVTATAYANGMDSAIAEDLNKKYGTIDEDAFLIGGKGWGDAYQLGMSVIDSALAVAVGGEAGSLGIFFGKAASSGYDEAMQRGASPGQALFVGFAQGAAEAVFEKFSVEKIVDMCKTGTIRTVFKEILEAGAVEGSEELATSIANFFTDEIIADLSGGLSESDQAIRDLMEAGVGFEDARKAVVLDKLKGLAWDAIGGALSGGVHAVGATGVSELRRSTTDYEGDTSDMLKVAGEVGVKSRLVEKLETKAKSGKLSIADVDRLTRATTKEMDKADSRARREAAEEQLVQRGLSKSEALALAAVIVKAQDGERVSSREQKLFQSSRAAQDVALEMGEFGMRQGQSRSVALGQRSASGLAQLEELRGELPAQQRTSPGAAWERAQGLRNKGTQPGLSTFRADMPGTQATDKSAWAREIGQYRHRPDLYGVRQTETQKRIAERKQVAEDLTPEVSTVKGAGKIVAPTADGKLRVRMSDGRLETMTADEAGLTGATRTLFDSVQELGDSGAAAYAYYDGSMDIDSYVAAWKAAEGLGEMGLKPQSVDKLQATNVLPKDARDKAFQLGQQKREGRETPHQSAAQTASPQGEANEGERARTQENQTQARRSGLRLERTSSEANELSSQPRKRGDAELARTRGSVSFEGGTVGGKTYRAVSEARAQNLNKRQEAAVNAAYALAEVTGFDFVFYDGESGKGNQGIYQEGGKIWLNINAGRHLGQSLISFAMSHELTHAIQEWAPEQYDALRQFVVEKVMQKGDLDALVANKQKAWEGLSFTEAVDEVVADGCEMMLKNSEAIQQLAKENQTLAQKIGEVLKDFVENLRTAFGDLPARHPEARLLMEDAEEAQRLWDAGIKAAVENRRAGYKNTALEGGNWFQVWDSDTEYDFGVNQQDINSYVEAAYANANTDAYRKYARVDERLIHDVETEISDIAEYTHAIRDNDVRHVRNSHGEKTSEKYPVTENDQKLIPYIIKNYDKVIVKTDQKGRPGLVYVKATGENLVYYLEAVTSQYGGEKLLVNKQMIKTGFKDIPHLYGLKEAISKKQTQSEFLADLEEVRKAYARSASQNGSVPDNSIAETSEKINSQNQVEDSPRNDRAILAAALESAAYNDAEREILRDYQDRIAKVDAIEADYRAAVQAYDEARAVDRWSDRTRELKEKADKLSDKLSKADRELMKLNAMRPLQEMMLREKKAERRRSAEKTRQKIAAKEEEQTLRRKIDRNVKRLSSYMLTNSKSKHIPEVLKPVIGDFLKSIDMTGKAGFYGGELSKRDVEFKTALEQVQRVLEKQITGQYDLTAAGDYAQEIGGFVDLAPDFIGELDKILSDVKEFEDQRKTKWTMATAKLPTLRQLDKCLTVLSHAVTHANELFTTQRFKEADKAGQRTLAEMRELGTQRRIKGVSDFLEYENMTPIYAFDSFGEVGKDIYSSIAEAQERYAKNIAEIFEFKKTKLKDIPFAEWAKETHRFELSNGETMEMTAMQMIDFYNTWMRSGETGKNHELGGGIRLKGEGEGILDDTAAAKQSMLQLSDVQQIIREMSQEQIRAADLLAEFITSKGGEWGNEVTMARWGYKQYEEDRYWPVSTVATDRPAKSEEREAGTGDMYRVQNFGFTKALTPNAKNAIVIEDALERFSRHMTDMAKHNAYSLALTDAMKWYNYKETEIISVEDSDYNDENSKVVYRKPKTSSVQHEIELARGRKARSFFVNFITDLNGSFDGGRDSGLVSKAVSNYKASSIGFNMRVVIQQPTSYVRAALVIKPKYLIAAKSTKASRAEMKISGLAQWKTDLGFYDMGAARSVRERLADHGDFISKVRDSSGWLAGFADEFTWGAIWDAAKKQVSAEKGLTGDALLEETKKLFNETVLRTQVMDSTITRSEMMRSKNGLVKEMTGFMSEPTMQYSIAAAQMIKIQDDARRSGDWKGAVRSNLGKSGFTLMVLAAGVLANAIASGLWDIGRDDDEYETFFEKWFEHAKKNFADGINPLTWVPMVKDLWEAADNLMQGKEWNTDMMYASGISRAVTAVLATIERFQLAADEDKKATSLTYYGRMTDWGLIYKDLQAASTLTGLPVSGAARSVTDAWNLIASLWNTVSGDKNGRHIRYASTYDAGPKNEIKYAWRDGWLSDEEAMEYLISEGVAKSEEDARRMLYKWGLDDSGVYDAAKDAAIADDRAAYDKAIAELEKNSYSKKDAQSEVKSAVKEAYQPDEDGRQRLGKQKAIERLVNYAGMKREDAEAEVLKWTCKVVTGIDYDKIDDVYISGEITLGRAKELWQKYGGRSEAEGESKSRWWRWKKENPEYEDLTEAKARDYYSLAQPKGVTPEQYYKFWISTKDLTSDKDADGKEVKGQTKKDKTLRAIDAMALTAEQKDALYYASGYAESGLKDAPWRA